MRLLGVVQEIAEVIGRQRALHLVGQLPRCYCKSNGSERREYVVLYVPKQINTQHNLVRILGWNDAAKLVRAFGGEILYPGNCNDIYRKFRDSSIIRLHAEGMPKSDVVSLMGVSERHVRNLILEKPQDEKIVANDNNLPVQIKAKSKHGRSATKRELLAR